MNRRKILVVDDSKTECLLLQLYLQKDYDVTIAENAIEFYADLAASLPDLILMDIVMKDISGLDLVRQIKQKDEYKEIPVIFLSGLSDEADIVRGFEAGAHDYVRKPFGPSELMARITSVMQIKILQEQLRLQAITDYLTGAFNRRHFFSLAKSHAEYCTRMKRPYCLALLDIDFFKKINDTWGHDAGDQILIHFVNLIKSELRAYDVFARHGGEEFVIQFVDCTAERSLGVLERLRAQLLANPPQYDGNTIPYTFSGGLVASIEMPAATPLDKLLQVADKRLYAAKNAGRNKLMHS